MTNKSGGRRSCPKSASVGDHIKQSGHEGTLEDFSIISKTSMTFELLIHESLLIQRIDPTYTPSNLLFPWFYSDHCSKYFHFYTLVVPILSLVICLLFVIMFAVYLQYVVYCCIFSKCFLIRPFLPHLSYSSIPTT